MELLHEVLDSPLKTLLCVGPLSTNIIDAAHEFTVREKFPIVLIASRAQIDAREFGGGYVNNWDTFEFAEYVQKKDNPNLYLARDHGGPWQGNHDKNHKLNVEESMQTAKRSQEQDIDAGFRFIHIDPSVPVGAEKLDLTTIVDRLFDLYAHAIEYSRKNDKKVYFEFGTEEQKGSSPNIESFEWFLEEVNAFCKKNKFDLPLFLVTQTGTKVMESRNTGVFESADISKRTAIMNLVKRTSDVAAKFGCRLKEHNTDFLSYENLVIRPRIGIKAANVAPELGFIETRTLGSLLRIHCGDREFEEFVDIVNESGKWKKWLSPNSTATRLDKAFIAGHYCYSDPRVVEIKNKLAHRLKPNDIELDELLKGAIKSTLYKYAFAFGLLSKTRPKSEFQSSFSLGNS